MTRYDPALVRLQEELADVGTTAEGLHQRVPLAPGAGAVDRDGQVHPRVDRVGDVEVIGRAHEQAPAPCEL